VKKICLLCLIALFFGVISFVAQAVVYSPGSIFPADEKELTVSNKTIYPIILTQVSGSRGFLMVSGGEHVLFSGEDGVLTFTIDTARWGCSFIVSAFFSDGEMGVVRVNLCKIKGERLEITFSEEKRDK
jgi:hypothetical protein